ncbi:MAG: sensor histidine kinase [Deltaproteobacteria bacterium]|nr:MAG: sensor histidine kinase [Deltaproteobacteria bacterium]
MKTGEVDLKAYPILYVDDEVNNLIVFEHVFRDRFSVRTAKSGEEALAVLEADPIAILLADLRMPGMDGVTLCEQVRTRWPEVTRMILTAYADGADPIDAINRGGVAQYLRKPWEAEELAGILRTAIELRAMRSAVEELGASLRAGERLALIGQATASVVHDLKAPVTTLKTALPLAREGDVEALDDMQAAIEHIAGLVESISLHARGRAPHLEPVDLGALVESVLPLCRVELLRKARLELDLNPAPEVHGDRLRLAQALLNLLMNAAQAIEGPRDAQRIGVRVAPREGGVELRIRDTGRGMDEATRARIFEPFFTTKGAAGTGLGLAIVREAVEAHGGTITVHSEPGVGTEFVVFLPAEGREPTG